MVSRHGVLVWRTVDTGQLYWLAGSLLVGWDIPDHNEQGNFLVQDFTSLRMV